MTPDDQTLGGDPENPTRMDRFLGAVERFGNKLPDPFIIFVALALIVIVLSAIAAAFGASVDHPGTGEAMPVRSLLSPEGVLYILDSLIDNFVGFAPLGLVLTIMLGIGLAERVGFLGVLVRRLMLAAPAKLATIITCFVGINMNLASDAAMILLPPLAALVFKEIGRHPVTGFVAGFACAGAGFTANLMISGTDVLLSGISTEAARIIDPEALVTPVANWYFNIVSVFVLTLVGAVITDRIIAPRMKGVQAEGDIETIEEPAEAGRGLRNVGIATLVFLALLVVFVAWPGSVLRNEDGGLVPSPFLSNIVPIIFAFFITVGLTYGISVGVIRSGKDVVAKMTESIVELAPYIVLVFAAAQFIAYFNWSGLGTWLAISGADALVAIEFTGFALLVAYSCLSAILEFFITSGSAKWALESPVFVPLLMQLGYDPGFIQLPYRVADSAFNILAPTNPYIFVALGFLRRYLPKAGLGTLIALMLPYAVSFFLVWQVLLAVFYFLNLPVGPGVYPLPA
ncbi:AbgT family transporter [Aureimonas mangrovi]|uniref:AbgT family transporter n=1 Tax=Aureimonas mangrovi TaxID=2758041 RepID=UPI00163DE59D|nr:AbgT family transporter [Aureimonas mangrovi]